jgi:hypothetical protein
MRWSEVFGGAAAGLTLASGVLATPAAAQTSGPDGWHFSVTPYVWMASLKGELATIPGLPEVDVDASFSDILDHMDLAGMVVAEARYQRFGAFVDAVYLDVSADEDTPGPLFSGVDVQSTSFFATIGGFYRAVEHGQFTLDVFPAMRVWDVDTELDFDPGLLPGRSVSDDESWVDPVVGMRGHMTLGRGFGLNAYFDYGGFGAASERTWVLAGTLDWAALDWLTLRAGYRHTDVDYENDGFEFDVRMTGPVIGAAIHF